MRIVKEAEERKSEILDVAEELFAQKGFDGTSTNDILDKVGIARGTLYYHFKSKEDIMDALIQRTTANMIITAQAIVKDKSLSVYERMVKMILSLNVDDERGKELIAHMHKPQNALMHQKAQKATLKGITPLLTEIIKDGIMEGLFHTPFPYDSMEMVMVYATTIFDDDDAEKMSIKEQMNRLNAFAFNVERLLGAESGSLNATIMSMMNK